MSIKTGRPDPIPNIRAAGRVIALGGEGADICLKGDAFGDGAPGIPEHLKRYRKTFQNSAWNEVASPRSY